MKKTLIISSLLLFGALTSRAVVDSTITPKSGNISISRITPRYIEDSSGVVVDTVKDTSYFNLNRYVELDDVYVISANTHANILFISLVETDLVSYAVVSYSLYDYGGNNLYTDKLRVCGSGFYYGFSLLPVGKGADYLFWKICSQRGFVAQH